jgi:competence ComEA-like helix-hairpin-helix protein
VGDTKLSKWVSWEHEGYPDRWSAFEEAKRELKKLIELGQLEDNVDTDATAKANVKVPLPRHRELTLTYTHSSGFKTVRMTGSVSKYEELLERVRKNTGTQYTYSDEGALVNLSAAELNKLVAGVRIQVYREASRIDELLEFGQIPATAIESTFQFVDSQLLGLIPSAAERLIVAYRNLAERNQENWENVVDTCRRVIKDFADAVFAPRDEPVGGLVVTDDKYLNRIRAFVRETVSSDQQRRHTNAVLELLSEMLARTDNLASRSVHSGAVSRFEAERVLIYTYLAIGDILFLSGRARRPDTVAERVNINRATYEELQDKLELSPQVAAEIVKYRKHRDFESWEDIASVKGVGPKTLDKLRDAASL